MRVLVVDDHAAFRRAVGDVLREEIAGAEIREATSAEEAACQAASDAPPDVVLLDLSLGGRNGLETLRALRRVHPDLPVIVISMHPEAQYGAPARAAGAAAYVAKGSGPAVLVEAVRKAAASTGSGGGAPAVREPPAAARVATPGTGFRAAALGLPDIDDERLRIARCLHDEVGQALAAAKISLGLAGTSSDPAELRQHTARASTVLTDAIEALRAVVTRLRPPLLDELGVVPAVRAWLSDGGIPPGGEVPALSAPPALPRAAPGLELAVFRLVEEAAGALFPRARAGRAGVALRREDDRLHISVTGGPSADEAPTLAGLAARVHAFGGRCKVESTPDGDMTLHVELPYPARGEH